MTPKANTKDLLPPEVFGRLLKEGYSVEEIVKPYCSRSRGYQILREYKEEYPQLFPQKKPLTKEILESYLVDHTLYEITKVFDISINTLKKRMEEFGVRKVSLKDKISPQDLQEGIDANLSDEELAELFDCSIHTIMKLRYTHGIYRRPIQHERKEV